MLSDSSAGDTTEHQRTNTRVSTVHTWRRPAATVLDAGGIGVANNDAFMPP
jgi:hypothetical protein